MLFFFGIDSISIEKKGITPFMEKNKEFILANNENVDDCLEKLSNPPKLNVDIVEIIP